MHILVSFRLGGLFPFCLKRKWGFVLLTAHFVESLLNVRFLVILRIFWSLSICDEDWSVIENYRYIETQCPTKQNLVPSHRVRLIGYCPTSSWLGALIAVPAALTHWIYVFEDLLLSRTEVHDSISCTLLVYCEFRNWFILGLVYFHMCIFISRHQESSTMFRALIQICWSSQTNHVFTTQGEVGAELRVSVLGPLTLVWTTFLCSLQVMEWGHWQWTMHIHSLGILHLVSRPAPYAVSHLI